MNGREVIAVMMVLPAWAPVARAKASVPLKLEQTIPLPDVQGRIDHLYATGGDGAISVFEQQDPDHYNEMGRIPTVKGARTGFFFPDLGRLYVAVRRQGSTAAQIQIFLGGQ